MNRLSAAAACLLALQPVHAAAPVPHDELRTFVEIMERIKASYVEPVDDATLLRNAVRGMLSGLDPHSAYLDEDGWGDVQALTSGRYDGLGLEVVADGGVLRVIAPIDGGPAQAAGVQPGDTILRIDDTPVQGLDQVEAVRLLRGPAGSRVQLQLVRDGLAAPFTIELERQRIAVASARGRLYDGRFLYLRLSIFNEHTTGEARDEYARLADQAGDALAGVVLDLRSNPGGVLEAATGVADLFLDQGLIVRAAGRAPTARFERSATAGDIAGGLPLVVLIDAGSASASEIVAGALQDHGRAVVMGEPSFGKGSVQSVLALDGGRGIKLTTALYYTPSGRSIQARGIVPDIKVTPVEVGPARHRTVTRESNLGRHLRNGEPEAPGAAPTASLAESDYTLHEALNLLRGLRIMRAQAPPRIAIIIDDIGDREADGERALALPGPVALAFLPHAPYSAAFAGRARGAGKEVLLHLPLQAVSGKDPGPGAITLDTGEREFRRLVGAGLDAVPGATGVNNHMGSLLTRHPGHMAWLMEEIRGRGGLYFVDSYTAVESVALAAAQEAGVPALRRDVFLDSDPDAAAVAREFERLLALARTRGSALGIGHPYPATLELLERELPRLRAAGIELVPVRSLLSAAPRSRTR